MYYMANRHHLNLLRRGKTSWNKWREKHPDIQPDLNEANLSGIDLRKVDFHDVTLSGANLSKANLSEADLNGVDLSGAVRREVT